jgi:hypothetical protein
MLRETGNEEQVLDRTAEVAATIAEEGRFGMSATPRPAMLTASACWPLDDMRTSSNCSPSRW